MILHGHRLEGEWALVPASLDGKERNWLIVRAAKEHAAGPARRYVPMRPRAARRVPSGPDWAFEIAWEGARAIAPIEGARARFERDGDDAPDERWSRLLARLPRGLRTSECVLDGVVCAFDEDGRPSRALLDGDTGSLVYVVFDLLELDAEPLIDEPWVGRRDRLAALLDDQAGELLLSRAYDDGRELRTAARARGLGIVAKHEQAAYRPGCRQRRLAPARPLTPRANWNVASTGSIPWSAMAKRASTTQVAVMGRLCADLYPEQLETPLSEVETFRRFVGGFAGNVATGLARLGVGCTIVSGIGDDGHGEYVRAYLEREGVDCTHLVTHPTLRTALAFCEAWPPDRFPDHLLPDADVSRLGAPLRRSRP